jgi:hypothetical protein
MYLGSLFASRKCSVRSGLTKKGKRTLGKMESGTTRRQKITKKEPIKKILYTDMMQKMSAGSRRRHLKGEKWLRQNASEPPPYNGRS